MSVPIFQNRADQLDYVFRKFVEFIHALSIQMGTIDSGFKNLSEFPSLALMGKASEIAQRYGTGLKAREMATVFKIIVDQNPGTISPEDLAEHALKFVTHLNKSPTNKDKFFLYSDIILSLLDY
jgi:hypothetical protein